MHGIAETEAYLSQADKAGMTAAEREAVILQVAADPRGGNLVKGSGGCRKVRVAGRGKGKSGGYRIMTLFGHEHMPVYLLAVLNKGRQANFTDAQIAALEKMAKAIIAKWPKP